MIIVNNPVTAAAIGAVPTSRTLTAGAGLTGGGDLSANRSFVASTLGFNQGYVAGRWYNPFPFLATTTGVGFLQNNIFLTPFVLEKPITVSDLGCRINVNAAGNVQLAIYAHNAATGAPTGNALASTGNISTAVAGGVSADITGADVALSAGVVYWMASNVDNSTVTLQCVSGAVASYLIGDTLANITPTSTTTNFWRKIAQTFGTWPDLTGGGTSVVALAAQNAALVFLKAS